MDGRTEDFGAKDKRQEEKARAQAKAHDEKEWALQLQQNRLEAKERALDDKDQILGKMKTTLNDALQQLQQPPSNAIVNSLIEVTENLQQLARTTSEPLTINVFNKLTDAIAKLRQLEQTLTASPNVLVNRLLAAFNQLNLSSERGRPAPVDPSHSDPFVDSEHVRPHVARRLNFQTASDPKRIAVGSPEFSGGRAPLIKARSASKMDRLQPLSDLGSDT